MELTEKGWQQARGVATNWTETPDLIVTSPYLHAQQTAQPTIERFPGVAVEVWPIIRPNISVWSDVSHIAIACLSAVL